MPSARPSTPLPGKWLNKIIRSPNESIDLERDFPKVTYFAAAHFMLLVTILSAVDPNVK